jgi:hypothetical protein
MIRSHFFAIPATVALGLALMPASSPAQQKSMRDQILGAWTILIVDTVNADNTRTPVYGPNPNGTVIFDNSGWYAIDLSRSNMPKFASNNPLQGTPDENKAIVQGSFSHSGKFEVDEASKTLTFHIRGSSFPNWQGSTQKRPLEILGTEDLKWTVAQAARGGTLELIWHRAK